MPSEFGLSLEGSETLDSVRAMARVADDSNASTIWLASHLFQREPITTAALILSATKNVKIALMAMSPYSVHPVYSTMAAATLNEQFPGRVKLCFGVGAPRDLEAAGLNADHPLGTLRESIQIARTLLNGETVHHDGQRFKVTGRRLSIGAQNLPIFLAASGPQMLELAGALADGVLISAATSPAFIRWTLDLVRKGEEQAGREIQKTALVFVSAADNETAAHNRLRRVLGFILRGQHHARNLSLAGTSLDQTALAKAYAREDWSAVEELVSDEVVRNHAVSGTPDQFHQAIKAYEDVGIDEIVAAGVGEVEQLKRALSAIGKSV
jgi:5,10-methylenetetrahydromethanopterin reductase